MNPPVPIGSMINDRYIVERVLGEGGMGVVVLAKHRVLDQKVAIKFLRRGPAMDETAVQRFVREAQAAAKLTSVYVARVHDVAVLSDGTPYIVMEYLEGATLAALIESGPLPVPDATRFALQICEVLAETHAAGIIHGDLKPENIYIAGADEARRVKLLDFGVSKIAFEDPVASAVVMGTPGYMAPEQLDHGLVTPQSDIFAFGTVLYEMLAGQPAFGSGSVDDVRAQMQRGPAPLVRRDLPVGLEDVIRSCLVVDPARRMKDALQVASALEPHAPAETSAVTRINRISTPVANLARSTTNRHAATVLVARRKGGVGPWLVAALAGVTITAFVVGLVLYVKPAALPWAKRSTAAAAPPAPAPLPVPSVAPATSVEVPPPPASVTEAPSALPAPLASGSAKPVASARPKSRPRPPPVEADRFGTRK